VKVSAAIKKVLKEKDKGIASGTGSMLAILKDLHKQVMAEMGKAALGSWDAYHLHQVLDAIEYQMANFTLKSKAELAGLLKEAWGYGKDLVDAPLAATEIHMGAHHLSTSVLDTMTDYANDYLQNLFHDAWYKVKGEITLGVVGGKTPQAVADAIGTTIETGRFKSIRGRAETITSNEMGTVFSKATQLRMEQATGQVPGLEKQWLHAGHPRKPRLPHLIADQVHVPVNQPFIIGGVKMMFPRDPAAPLIETINCGCDHVPFHASWGEARKAERQAA
jgi:hypothetical protein